MASKSARTRSVSPQMRRARLQAWHPHGQIARTLKTEEIPYTGDLAALIVRAARLCPRWRPRSLWVGLSDQEGLSLDIDFGSNRRGTSFRVSIQLTLADFAALFAYAARASAQIEGLIIALAYPDEDGGEELPVPRVTVDELAAMPTPALVL